MTKLTEAIKAGNRDLSLQIINKKNSEASREWSDYWYDQWFKVPDVKSAVKYLTAQPFYRYNPWNPPEPYLEYQIFHNNGWDAASLALNKGMLDVYQAMTTPSIRFPTHRNTRLNNYENVGIPGRFEYVAIGSNNLEIIKHFFFGKNDLIVTQRLCGYYAGVNQFTPLQFALAANCSLEVVKYLLENGANPNELLSKDPTDAAMVEITPGGKRINLFSNGIKSAGALFIAIHYCADNPETVSILNLLLASDAKIDQDTVYNGKQYNPLSYAKALGKPAIVEAIIQAEESVINRVFYRIGVF